MLWKTKINFVKLIREKYTVSKFAYISYFIIAAMLMCRRTLLMALPWVAELIRFHCISSLVHAIYEVQINNDS